MDFVREWVWPFTKVATLVAVLVWLLIAWMRRSREDASTLISKLALTGPLLVLSLVSIPVLGVFGPFLIVACAVGFSVIWAPVIGASMASLITDLFDGGGEEPVARPLLSIAQTKRQRGKPTEAMAELRRQLDKFPDDFDGLMLLAAIQAEDLHDLTSAQATIMKVLHHTEISPSQIAFALNNLAEWQLKIGQDADAAQQAWERLRGLLPGTESAHQAAQRIAHLHAPVGPARPRLVLPSSDSPNTSPVSTNEPATQALETEAALQLHLEQFPLDNAARETLAQWYADQEQLAPAVEQLTRLLGQPQASAKQTVRWLNLLADYHLRLAGDEEAASAALRRVIEANPNSAAAETAQKRLSSLKLELRSKQKSQVLKLGSYETDLGLKPDP